MKITESGLVRAVGTWGLAASIVNLTIGGGIFRLPSGAAAAVGAEAPVVYVVCAVAMGLIVLCFAEAGSRVAVTGSVYAYVEVAFGRFFGFMAGITLWAGITLALAAVSTFFADSLGALVPALGGGVAHTWIIVVVLAALAGLNVLGIRSANRFNATVTVAKLVPLAILIVFGAFAMHGANLAWKESASLPQVGRASILLIFAFLGVESALVPGGEVRDPARTVPRAIFLAMAGVTVVYLAVQLVSQGILGASLAGSATPLADAAGTAFGGWGRTLILVGSVVSMFGYISGMILAVPRVLFAFGRDGFLPSRLAKLHPRFHTPLTAIVVQTLLVIALAATRGFEKLVILANGSILIVYAACCLAAWELRRRDVRSAEGLPFRVPGGALVPALALVVIAFLLASLKKDEWIAIGAWLVVSAILYLLAAARGRAEAVNV